MTLPDAGKGAVVEGVEGDCYLGSMAIDIEIDKFTNSIENVRTGEVFDTAVMRITAKDRRLKKMNWRFNWNLELKQPAREVYALTTMADRSIVQGLMSLEDKGDHVFVHLIESARFNQGRNKVYQGVAPNLFAFACRRAFDLNRGGVVSFVSKTALKDHYAATLGAANLFGDAMVIGPKQAQELVDRYFSTHG